LFAPHINIGVRRFLKLNNMKTFNNMKKLRLSQKTQDYFWGVTFTISALLWIYIVSFFLL
jgi:hypothetical protein